MRFVFTAVSACLFLVASAVPAFAGDVSGKWTGNVEIRKPDGEMHHGPVVVNLKQSGTEVTGTAGESEDDQRQIRNGKVDGDKLTFEVHVEDDSGTRIFKVNLTATEKDKLEGTVDRHSSDGQVVNGKLMLERKL